ncbi:hypothetical protein pb186bvf_017947 [Paramecium bursaria]
MKNNYLFTSIISNIIEKKGEEMRRKSQKVQIIDYPYQMKIRKQTQPGQILENHSTQTKQQNLIKILRKKNQTVSKHNINTISYKLLKNIIEIQHHHSIHSTFDIYVYNLNILFSSLLPIPHNNIINKEIITSITPNGNTSLIQISSLVSSSHFDYLSQIQYRKFPIYKLILQSQKLNFFQ